MHRMSQWLRSSSVATALVAVLALSSLGAARAAPKASRYAAEISRVEIAERQLTLKASMGQQTMRVARRVRLDAIRAGDKVLLTFGQEGTESVITGIEVVK